MVEFVAVIPARYASTRLPGKPLLEIAGAPMVVHVARRARASGAHSVIVATDDQRIAEAVTRAGFEAALTAPDHPSGTDRIAEVARMRGWSEDTIVVNVQGDEPLIEPALVAQVAQKLASAPDAAMATVCCALDPAELTNPNVVKAVLDRDGYALYFSRAPIPYPRDAFRDARRELPADYAGYRHIGLYAYRCRFLHAYSGLAAAPLERFEALEQLRALWHGFRIAVCVSALAPVAGVDTEDDLARVRAHLEGVR